MSPNGQGTKPPSSRLGTLCSRCRQRHIYRSAGIEDKLRYIRSTLAGQFAVIAFTETHLNNKQNVDLSVRPGTLPYLYSAVGRDRLTGWCRSTCCQFFVLKRRLDLEAQPIENMWLEIRHSNFKFLLCVSYNPETRQ